MTFRIMDLIVLFVLINIIPNNPADAAMKSYKNFKLLRIQGDREKVLKLNQIDLKNLEEPPSLLSYNHQKHEALYIAHEDDFEDILNFTRENNLRLSIKPNKIDQQIKFVNELNDGQRMANKLHNRNGGIYNDRPYYMRYGEMKDWLKETAQKSNFTSFEIIGKTFEERDIVLLKISKNTSKPIIWIDGGIHAREWISPAAVIGLIKFLLKASPNSDKYLQDYQFYFIPVMNPDGYEYSHEIDRMWRKNRVNTSENCYGVDLNRNFPYKWGGKGSSPLPCQETYRGNSANSELETQIVMRIMKLYQGKITLYLNLHSYGQYILMPYAYEANRYTRNYFFALELAQKSALSIESKYSKIYKVGTSSLLLYSAAGTIDDFAAGTLNIEYSYTVELPDTGRYGFAIPPRYISSAVGQVKVMLDCFYRYKRISRP